MRKRCLSLLLAVLMLASMVPATAGAESAEAEETREDTGLIAAASAAVEEPEVADEVSAAATKELTAKEYFELCTYYPCSCIIHHSDIEVYHYPFPRHYYDESNGYKITDWKQNRVTLFDEELTATGLYQTTDDHWFYRVHVDNIGDFFVLASETYVVQKLTPPIDISFNVPSSIREGSEYSSIVTIKSDYTRLNNVALILYTDELIQVARQDVYTNYFNSDNFTRNKPSLAKFKPGPAKCIVDANFDLYYIEGYDHDRLVRYSVSVEKTFEFLITAGPSSSEYVEQSCTYYPSHFVLQVPSNGSVICSAPTTSPDTDRVSNYEYNSVYGNSILTATALYKNSHGQFWYRVDGGYIPAEKLTILGVPNDTLSISIDLPDSITHGNKQTLRATVLADGAEIDSVTGILTDAQGRRQTKTVSGIGKNVYSVAGTSIDNGLRFGSLSVGDAVCTIKAEATLYYSEDGKTLNRRTVSASESHTLTVEQAYNYLTVSCFNDNDDSSIAYSGTFDVYIDGALAASQVDEYHDRLPVGTSYEVRNIQAKTGYAYIGSETAYVGSLGEYGTRVSLSFATKDKYVLRFDGNGGTGNMSPIRAQYNADFTLPANEFTLVGYRFNGWHVLRDDGKWAAEGGGWFTEDQLLADGRVKQVFPDGDTKGLDYSWLIDGERETRFTFYAIWVKAPDNVKIITFDVNGGSAFQQAQQEAERGQETQLIYYIPSKSGHSFLGWSIDPDAVEADYLPGDTIVVNEDTTLYAVYSMNPYETLTLYLFWPGLTPDMTASGNYRIERIFYKGYKDGASIGELGWTLYDETNWPSEHSTFGWELEGWYCDGVKITDETIMHFGDAMIASPRWVEKTGLFVTYSANGYNHTEEIVSDVFTVPDEVPSYSENFLNNVEPAFLGWRNYDKEDDWYLPGETYSIETSLHLYACWQEVGRVRQYMWDQLYEKEHDLFSIDFSTYDSYGTVIDGQTLGSLGVPLYDDLTWPDGPVAGWRLTEWYTGGFFGTAKTTVNSDTEVTVGNLFELYPRWEEDSRYLLVYDANGGSVAPAPLKAEPGSALSLSEAAVREGCVFLGWARSAAATTPDYRPGDTLTLNEDTTLYAVWVKPDLVLPASLTGIEEEAFAGGAFTCVMLPEQTVTIGRRAFADCPNLAYIIIPASVAAIDMSAFDGVTEGITILGQSGSYAETFAQENGFAFNAAFR